MLCRSGWALYAATHTPARLSSHTTLSPTFHKCCLLLITVAVGMVTGQEEIMLNSTETTGDNLTLVNSPPAIADFPEPGSTPPAKPSVIAAFTCAICVLLVVIYLAHRKSKQLKAKDADHEAFIRTFWENAFFHSNGPASQTPEGKESGPASPATTSAYERFTNGLVRSSSVYNWAPHPWRMLSKPAQGVRKQLSVMSTIEFRVDGLADSSLEEQDAEQGGDSGAAELSTVHRPAVVAGDAIFGRTPMMSPPSSLPISPPMFSSSIVNRGGFLAQHTGQFRTRSSSVSVDRSDWGPASPDDTLQVYSSHIKLANGSPSSSSIESGMKVATPRYHSTHYDDVVVHSSRATSQRHRKTDYDSETTSDFYNPYEYFLGSGWDQSKATARYGTVNKRRLPNRKTLGAKPGPSAVGKAFAGARPAPFDPNPSWMSHLGPLPAKSKTGWSISSDSDRESIQFPADGFKPAGKNPSPHRLPRLPDKVRVCHSDGVISCLTSYKRHCDEQAGGSGALGVLLERHSVRTPCTPTADDDFAVDGNSRRRDATPASSVAYAAVTRGPIEVDASGVGDSTAPAVSSGADANQVGTHAEDDAPNMDCKSSTPDIVIRDDRPANDGVQTGHEDCEPGPEDGNTPEGDMTEGGIRHKRRSGETCRDQK